MILDHKGREVRTPAGFHSDIVTIQSAEMLRSMVGFGVQPSPLVDEFGRDMIAATNRTKIGDTVFVQRPARYRTSV